MNPSENALATNKDNMSDVESTSSKSLSGQTNLSDTNSKVHRSNLGHRRQEVLKSLKHNRSSDGFEHLSDDHSVNTHLKSSKSTHHKYIHSPKMRTSNIDTSSEEYSKHNKKTKKSSHNKKTKKSSHNKKSKKSLHNKSNLKNHRTKHTVAPPNIATSTNNRHTKRYTGFSNSLNLRKSAGKSPIASLDSNTDTGSSSYTGSSSDLNSYIGSDVELNIEDEIHSLHHELEVLNINFNHLSGSYSTLGERYLSTIRRLSQVEKTLHLILHSINESNKAAEKRHLYLTSYMLVTSGMLIMKKGKTNESEPSTVHSIVAKNDISDSKVTLPTDSNSDNDEKTDIIDIDTLRELTNGGTPEDKIKLMLQILDIDKSEIIKYLSIEAIPTPHPNNDSEN